MEPIQTREQLQKLIDDQIDENAGIEYKGAGAIGKADQKKRDITKDVSAFANSAGGTIIYGISEAAEGNAPRSPVAIDPINCADFSKEWLDQIIGQIRPKIPGLIITPVHVGPSENEFAYVVTVPQGSTAHQSLDRRYYCRRNFESTAMEDYEIRDVMNRAIHPTLDVYVRVVSDFPFDKTSHIAVKLCNLGEVMARHYSVIVRLPMALANGLFYTENGALRTEDGKGYWLLNFSNNAGSPLFPGGEVVFRRDFKHQQEMKPELPSLLTDIKVTVYADNMPKMNLTKSLREAERLWA